MNPHYNKEMGKTPSRLHSTIILILLSASVSPDCTEGTLRCSSSNIPLVCDFTQHYRLSDDKKACKLEPIDGCELSSFDETSKPCYLCASGNVYNDEKTKCSPLGFTDRIDKCLRYDANTQGCLTCRADFYLDVVSGKCLAIGETKVANCEYYATGEDCKSCLEGYYLKEGKCEVAPEVEHCLVTTFHLCERCKTGYELVRGGGETPIFDASFFKSVQATVSSKMGVSLNGNQRPICLKKNVSHCQVYESFSECKRCSADYFVNASKICERNPETKIANCVKYSSGTTCVECKVTFYVSGDPTVCAEVTVVPSCKTYEKLADKCLQCDEGNYLSRGDNTCPLRTRSPIGGCATNDLEADACKVCEEKFSASSPNRYKCLADLENCPVGNQVAGDDAASSHTCSACLDKTFYLTSGLCVKGNVANCLELESDRNECVRCDKNFYRASASSCLEAGKSNCTLYVENTDNCSECGAGFYIKDNGCTAQTKTNCDKHSSNSDNCEECQAGFYVDGGGDCQRQTLSRCAAHVKNKNECLTCSLGYFPDGNKLCIANSVLNCKLYKVNTNECVICSKGYYAKEAGCVAQSLDGCIDYNDNFNSCKYCQGGKYYDGSDCIDVVHVGCIEWETNKNTCVKCAVSHYKLIGSNTVATCTARDKTHCVLYTDDTNLCVKCSHGYYAKEGGCERGSQEYCDTLLDAEDKCSSCVQGYYPDVNGVCQTVSAVSGCVTYKTTEDTCEMCGVGKYTADGSACVAKTIAHCETYSGSYTAAECVKCIGTLKKKISVDKSTCDDITNSVGCYSSAGTSVDQCDACVPGSFLESGVCSGSSTGTLFDSNCQGHSNVDNATICTVCGGNYKPAVGILKPALARSFLNGNNCGKINAVNGGCTQCLDHYFLETNVCSPFLGSPLDKICRRKMLNSSTSLDSGVTCEECEFQSHHYLLSNTCTSRGASVNTKGCQQYDSLTATCLSCMKGWYPAVQNFEDRCEATSTVNPSGTVVNCQVFSGVSDCHICDQGYKLTGSVGANTCTAVSATDSLNRTYSADLGPSASLEASQVANCQTYAQTDGGTLKCVKCQNNYVGIVDYDATNTSTKYAVAYAENAHVENKDEVDVFSKCVDGNLWYLNYMSPSMRDAGYCEVGYQIGSDTTGYACLRCRPGRRGQFGGADTSKSGSTISGSVLFALFTCDAYSLAKKLYSFMSGSLVNKPTALRYSTHLAYDSCVDGANDVTPSGTKALLYMYVLMKDQGHLTRSMRVDTNGGLSLLEFYCLPKARVESTTNCAFFILGEELSGNVDTTSHDFSSVAICGGCSPGYKPSFETGKVNITGCSAIVNISTSGASNTWLNAGSTPTTSGWKFDVSQDPPVIDYSTALTGAQTKANCLAADISNGDVNTECVLCGEGWEPYQGECVMTVAKGDDCQYRMGRMYVLMATAPAEKVNAQFVNLIRARWAVTDANYASLTSPFCKSCGNAKSARFDGSKTLAICTKQSSAPSSTVTNCDHVSVTDKTKCVKCASTYALKSSDKTCVAGISSLANCTDVDSGSNCTACASGYGLLADLTCALHYCKHFDPVNVGNCAVCDDDKGLDGVKTTHCSSASNGDTDCLNMSAILGHCVSSKVGGKIPYIIRIIESSVEKPLVTEHVAYPLTGNGYNMINNEYVYVETVQNLDTNTSTVSLKGAQTVDHKTREIDNSNISDPAGSACVPFRAGMTGCIENAGIFCTKCDVGYGLKSDGTCVASTVVRCGVSTENSGGTGFDCVECENDYILGSGPVNCTTLRSDSVGIKCLTRKADEDKCESCHYGKYLTAGKLCETNTALNCAVKSIIANECATCANKYHLNTASPKICVAHNAINCKSYTNSADTCIDCAFGYKKGVSTLCEVIPYSVCKTWHATSKECGTCSEQMNLSPSLALMGQCAHKTSEKCLTFSPNEDKCASCKPGFILDAAGACVVNTASNCGDFKPGLHECETCAPNTRIITAPACGFRVAALCESFVTTGEDECGVCVESAYKNGSKQCTRPTDPHCLKVLPTEDKCESCQSGWVVDANGSGVCSVNTFDGCKELAPGVERCESCNVGKYLTLESKCMVNNATGCLERSVLANNCVSCAEDFWLDTVGDNRCREYTADNCETKSKEKNECLTCKTGILKKVTGSGGIECVKYSALNCKDFEGLKDECLTCLETHFESLDLSSVKTCQIRLIMDCKEFEISKDECKICVNEKYLSSEKKCVSSTVVSNCLLYSSELDECASCDEGFYKPSFANECWHYPDGIDNCLEYSSRTSCSRCKLGFYLSGNLCETVTGSVADCEIYSSATECSLCKAGKWLKETVCVDITALNCKEYLNETTCSLCLLGYVKNSTTSLCESIGISLCVKGAVSESGSTCDECLAGSILSPDKKACESATVDVSECYQYASKEKCGQCKEGFVLSADGLKCGEIGNLAGENCAVGKSLASAACDLCELGYLLESSGSCSKIGIENCFLPNAGGSVCEICLPGTYMDTAGKCNKPSKTTTDGGMILRVVGLVWVLGLACLL